MWFMRESVIFVPKTQEFLRESDRFGDSDRKLRARG